MSSTYGENLKITIFGESHSPAIGVTMEGIPAGEKIDLAALDAFLLRRAPGRNAYSTARKEADAPEFLSGIRECDPAEPATAVTTGTPVAAIIRNTDARSKDYSELKVKPRPGHADYTAEVKYFGSQAYEGGGHFSGRLTAPLCIAGGIALQLLEREGIKVISRIASVGPVSDEGALTESTAGRAFPTVSASAGEAMKAYIAEKKAEGDSAGGIIECQVLGLPAGIGDPIFGGLENRIASAVFGIPAVKGIEFGAGFEAAKMTGSEHNDAFISVDGKIQTETNHAGGILGGISNGMPVVFRVAVKPTPSIAKPQKTVDLRTGEETELVISGRHDPCIVPRAVPAVEAAAAVAVYDAVLERRKETAGKA